METTKFQCLICSEEKFMSEINKCSRNTCQQFCVIMCRYLNFNPGLVTSFITKTMKMDPLNITAAGEAPKSNLTNEDKAGQILCCDKCLILVRSICDIYKNWSYLQLRLNKSIRVVAEMMKRTSSVMPRTITNDGANNCQRSEFRKHFVKRVLDKKSPHDFPHLSLEQCCQNHPLMKARVKVENNINSESNTNDYDSIVIKTEVHSPYNDDHYYIENGHEEHLDNLDPEPGESHDFLDADNVHDDDDIPQVKTEAPSPVVIIVARVKRDENSLVGSKAKARTTRNPVRPTKCQTCGKVFASSNYLRKHLAIHKTEKKFECQHCGMRFKTQKYLLAHMRCHCTLRHAAHDAHLQSPTTALETEREKPDTSWFTILKEEPARYTKTGRHLGFPWKCNICGRVLIGNKKKHLRTHNAKSESDLKTFQCDECGRTFKFHESLCRHIKENHTPNCVKRRQPKKQCSDCGRIFSNGSTLRRHQKREMGKCKLAARETKADLENADSRETKCQICGKNFPRPYYLKRHLLSHSSEPSYQCQECGARFKYGDALRSHVRIKHSEEGAELLNARNERRRLKRLAAKLKKEDEDEVVDVKVEVVRESDASKESSSITN